MNGALDYVNTITKQFENDRNWQCLNHVNPFTILATRSLEFHDKEVYRDLRESMNLVSEASKNVPFSRFRVFARFQIVPFRAPF